MDPLPSRLCIDRRRALSLGADDYVTTPFDDEEVYLRLRNIVSHRTARSTSSTAVIASQTLRTPCHSGSLFQASTCAVPSKPSISRSRTAA